MSDPTTRKDSPDAVRCAVYTRKSSEEGLHQEFNSLDAQRQAAQAYIASQQARGWILIAQRYDDGGYSGGDLRRPALQRLLQDIQAGQIDCVLVYKVDRLSRSLLDFARLMETFEQHRVSFVCVTQQFNTSQPMGRLTLHILLSFAQFEREIIGERIRDKIAASRRQGRWTGGIPILGYDVDRSGGSPRLVVNPSEAEQVRQIFALYIEWGSLLRVVQELHRRDWRMKVWTTGAGRRQGGQPFDKCKLYNLLTNVLYTGQIKHKGIVYPGLHPALITGELFQRVQDQLRDNGRSGGRQRVRCPVLLRGLLYCQSCGRVMLHTYSRRRDQRYRYYTCSNVIKRGRASCPTPSLPAPKIEQAILGELQTTVRDRLARALRQVQALQTNDSTNEHQTEPSIERENRMRAAFTAAQLDSAWGTLDPQDQARVLQALVRRIEFDAHGGMRIGLRPEAIDDQHSAEEAA